MRRIKALGRDGWAVIAVAAALLLPLLVLFVVVLIDQHTAPGGDQALIQLRVSDVFTSHTPLIGSYQRFGWNQPGPGYFYLLAIPYRIFGSNYAALQAGAVIINALAVGGILAVAYRRGGLALYVWTAALLGVVLHTLEPYMLANPWEPDISVLAVLLLIFLAFDMASGGAWTIPIAAVVAALLVQGWATTAPIAIALFGWGVVAFAFHQYRVRAHTQAAMFAEAGPPSAATERAVGQSADGDPRREGTDGDPGRGGSWRWPAVVTVGLLLVMAIPPLVQELRSDDGNITLMARFFRHGHDVLGFPDAFRMLSLQLGTRPIWAGAPLPLFPFEAIVRLDAAPVVPVILVLFVAALAFAAFRRDRSLTLGLTVAVVILAEIVALSRLVGEVFVEIMQPTWAIGAATALAAGWCLASPLRGETRSWVRRIGGPVLAVVIVGFGVANTALAFDGPPPPPRADQAVGNLADRVVPTARNARGPVLLDPAGLGPLGTLGTQVVGLTLDRAGIDVVVPPDLANRFGTFRTDTGQAVLAVRVTYADEAPTDGWHVVATIDPLTAAERRERDRLDEQIDARLGPDVSASERLKRYAEDPVLERLAARRAKVAQRALSISTRPLPAP